jgi:hypothetical protein
MIAGDAHAGTLLRPRRDNRWQATPLVRRVETPIRRSDQR